MNPELNDNNGGIFHCDNETLSLHPYPSQEGLPQEGLPQEGLLERRDTTKYYSEREMKKINGECAILETEIDDMLDAGLIYPEQIKTATIISEAYKNRKITYSQLISEMQSGKTGTTIYIVYLLKKYELIPNDNIFFITGYSSNDWKEQTKKRLPKSWKNNVYHRQDIEK